jgi:Glycosyl transferase family 2
MVVAHLEPATMVMKRLTTIGSLSAVAIAAHTVVNLNALRKPNVVAPPLLEKISVLIPARNEADNILRAVSSVLASIGVPHLEVLVLDDGSTDATAAIVSGIDDPRVRLITGTEEPPTGWLGKPWACKRLSLEASGPVLVFIDADVELSPDAIRASVGELRARNFSMVSPYPLQIAESWLERLVQPIVTWSWCAFLPLDWSQRSTRPSLSAANGQFLVIDADSYRAIEGHASVAGEVLEDIALMRALKTSGELTCTMDGSAIATCRMYATTDEVVDGYAKSLWAGFGGPAGSIAVNLFMLTAYVVPPVAALTARSPRTRTLGVVGYAAGVASRALVARRTSARVWPDSAAHPVSITAFAVLSAISWSRHLRGSNSWKGRSLP